MSETQTPETCTTCRSNQYITCTDCNGRSAHWCPKDLAAMEGRGTYCPIENPCNPCEDTGTRECPDCAAAGMI